LAVAKVVDSKNAICSDPQYLVRSSATHTWSSTEQVARPATKQTIPPVRLETSGGVLQRWRSAGLLPSAPLLAGDIDRQQRPPGTAAATAPQHTALSSNAGSVTLTAKVRG